MIKYTLIFLSLLIIVSCNPSPPLPPRKWRLISGRIEDSSVKKPLLYRAYLPSRWIQVELNREVSIMDTTQPVAEFFLEENERKIRLTFHTFPIHEDFQRIPPEAQIARWKQQFDELDPLSILISPVSHGGFHGLAFEGQGVLKEEPAAVMGWSMLLADIYARQLKESFSLADQTKRADYTIKATGDPDMVRRYRTEIANFAQSFELIEELPAQQ